jgi:hypothetical protein
MGYVSTISSLLQNNNIFLHKGGYAFITNMIPLHALVLVLMGRFSDRLYVAYSSWYAIGTLSSMQVPFVGFQPVSTSEHMGALGVIYPYHIFGHKLKIPYQRRVWVASNRGVWSIGANPRIVAAVPETPCRCRYCHWSPWGFWLRFLNLQRQNCPMDWPLLLPLGYWLRQKVSLR